jgi:PleD family two-component response regulator
LLPDHEGASARPPTLSEWGRPIAADAPSLHQYMAISVAIVEDNPEVRRNLSRYIDGAPGFRCTCACASAEEALRVIPQSPPDVVLMDIQLPG